ncbi:AraC family transcriptional regulator [Dyadobacter psychrotolerans]|uniref:AraC family transcriptional regulator n=1 Tax=Dyadobacter psychrotolerans TaxID=2541721 RepID=A0A4R5DUJ4_9BACT|nr:AraC family transcriptional regulator [Dyadobacter psychrotolerans]TDE16154.1 AraC family transcriptional regulator [Dyadobacter psychrotolerans]
MKSAEKSLPSNLEIPHLMGALGLSDALPGLMVFDSSVHLFDNTWKRPFRSAHYSVILVQKGQMYVKVNLQEYTLHQGELLIIPPSAIREMSWQENSVHFLSLLFSADFILASGNYTKSVARFPLFKSDEQAMISLNPADQAIVSRMIELIHLLLIRDHAAQKVNEEMIRSVFQAVISQVGYCYEEQRKLSSSYNSIVQQFFNLLVSHYKTERNVSFYASLLGIHEKYLSQLLKQKTTHTARSFMIQMVILEAKVLLDYPNLTISNIADQLHFQNQFHFSRFFKKYTALTPTDYRNGLS